ncbi:MAG TPA: oligosaccharide flippase family protein [Candidatus Thermoplasmatota archaeon]|nr:oligosaccharide flippase family protein [Candidatus Thermoplasmatota archaeon]
MKDGNAGRKATLVLLSNFAGAALGYGSLLLIGRYFAPDSYGAYLFALSLTGLVALLSNLGLGMAHQRQVAQGIDPSRALGVLARLRLAVALPVLALAALAYAIWSAVKGHAVTDATTPAVLALALTVQVLSGTRQSLFDTWQGQQRVHRIELAKSLDTLLVVFLLGNAALLVAHLQGRWEVLPGIGGFWADTLSLAVAPTPAEGALILATCYVIAKGLSLALALAWWMGDGIRIGPWDRQLAREYLRFAMPLALAGSLSLVLQYTDTLMLGFFWTANEVGLYGAAQRLSGLCLLGALALGTVLFPRFAQLYAAGDTTGERKTFDKAERYLLLFVTPIAAAMVALPREGLHVVVGDAYLEADGPLRFLALWTLVGALEHPLVARMMAAGHTTLMVRAGALNAVGNVLLNLLLIPTTLGGMGPTGAGLATLLATLLAYLYVRWQGRLHYGIPLMSLPQVRILVAGLAAGAFWVLAARFSSAGAFDRSWELGAWGVGGALVYGVALALLGELRREDREFLRKVTHPRELLAEIRGR